VLLVLVLQTLVLQTLVLVLLCKRARSQRLGCAVDDAEAEIDLSESGR
jgi:hypothetical protein